MIKTKTIKTPLVMAEAFGPMCCSSPLVPESKLSHRLQEHPGLVPKRSHRRGKNKKYAARTNSCIGKNTPKGQQAHSPGQRPGKSVTRRTYALKGQKR